MALSDKVTARLSAQELKNLTNPDAGSQASTNTTRLGLACDDVEADFKTVGGLTYDDSDARHVQVAVLGVRAKLMLYGAGSPALAEKAEERFHARLAQLARGTVRARVRPSTSSPYTPSELDASETHRPPFDDRHFEGIVTGPPKHGTERYEDD